MRAGRRFPQQALRPFVDRIVLRRETEASWTEERILERLRGATARAGYDPEYFCGLDRAVDVPYHVAPGTTERIWVVGLGRPGPRAQVSPIVDVLREWQVGRTLNLCPLEAR